MTTILSRRVFLSGLAGLGLTGCQTTTMPATRGSRSGLDDITVQAVDYSGVGHVPGFGGPLGDPREQACPTVSLSAGAQAALRQIGVQLTTLPHELQLNHFNTLLLGASTATTTNCHDPGGNAQVYGLASGSSNALSNGHDGRVVDINNPLDGLYAWRFAVAKPQEAALQPDGSLHWLTHIAQVAQKVGYPANFRHYDVSGWGTVSITTGLHSNGNHRALMMLRTRRGYVVNVYIRGLEPDPTPPYAFLLELAQHMRPVSA